MTDIVYAIEQHIRPHIEYLHDRACAHLRAESLRTSLTVLAASDMGWLSQPCDALRRAEAAAVRAARAAARRRNS